jgi:hypothetical protein
MEIAGWLWKVPGERSASHQPQDSAGQRCVFSGVSGSAKGLEKSNIKEKPMKPVSTKSGVALLFAVALVYSYGVQAEGCDDYPYSAGEISYQDTPAGPKILSTGAATVEFDDVDEVNDARMEAELEAKNAISKFFNEDIRSEESIESAGLKKIRIVKGADGQAKTATRDKVKATLRTLSSKSHSLLRGVVKLAECYSKGKLVMVSVGLKPETIAAAEAGTKEIGDSFARQPTTTRSSGQDTQGGAVGGDGSSTGPDSYSRGVDKLEKF